MFQLLKSREMGGDRQCCRDEICGFGYLVDVGFKSEVGVEYDEIRSDLSHLSLRKLLCIQCLISIRQLMRLD